MEPSSGWENDGGGVKSFLQCVMSAQTTAHPPPVSSDCFCLFLYSFFGGGGGYLFLYVCFNWQL